MTQLKLYLEQTEHITTQNRAQLYSDYLEQTTHITTQNRA